MPISYLLHKYTGKFCMKMHAVVCFSRSVLIYCVWFVLKDEPRGKPQSTFFLKWKQGSNMQIGMSDGVQSVVTKKGVFVGGGKARDHHDECTVN